MVVVEEEEEEQEGQSRREEKKENSEDWGLQNSRRVCRSTKKDFQTKLLFTHNLLHLCRTTNRYILRRATATLRTQQPTHPQPLMSCY